MNFTRFCKHLCSQCLPMMNFLQRNVKEIPKLNLIRNVMMIIIFFFHIKKQTKKKKMEKLKSTKRATVP